MATTSTVPGNDTGHLLWEMTQDGVGWGEGIPHEDRGEVRKGGNTALNTPLHWSNLLGITSSSNNEKSNCRSPFPHFFPSFAMRQNRCCFYDETLCLQPGSHIYSQTSQQQISLGQILPAADGGIACMWDVAGCECACRVCVCGVCVCVQREMQDR